MAEKPTFQETFFPAPNPAGNEVIFGDRNQNSLQEETDTTAERPAEGIESSGSDSQDGSAEPSKKVSRRARPPKVVEKEVFKEANYWKSTALQESEKVKALEQQRQALLNEMADKENARRQAEFKALTEREDNLKLQRSIALAAGNEEFAQTINDSLQDARTQKHLQNYDRSVRGSEPHFSYHEESPSREPTMERRMSPLEAMRQEAYGRFLQRNPWFGKNPKLTQAAQGMMEEFNNILDFAHRADDIYCDDYFLTVEDEMQKHLGLKRLEDQQGGEGRTDASSHYEEPRSKPSTRFADVPRGQTMAEEDAQRFGGRTFTPQELQRTGGQGLEMKVGNKWVTGEVAKTEAAKHRKRIVPLAKGFQIRFQQ